MQIQLISAFTALAGLFAGAIIGGAFGLIQEAAWRRHRRLQQTGEFSNGWAAMPGSFRRVAGLLLALALVQCFFPLFFAGSAKWWVSAGVVGGYGLTLLRNLRERLSQD